MATVLKMGPDMEPQKYPPDGAKVVQVQFEGLFKNVLNARFNLQRNDPDEVELWETTDKFCICWNVGMQRSTLCVIESEVAVSGKCQLCNNNQC